MQIQSIRLKKHKFRCQSSNPAGSIIELLFIIIPKYCITHCARGNRFAFHINITAKDVFNSKAFSLAKHFGVSQLLKHFNFLILKNEKYIFKKMDISILIR